MSKLTRQEIYNYLEDCWAISPSEFSEWSVSELVTYLKQHNKYQEALDYNGK